MNRENLSRRGVSRRGRPRRGLSWLGAPRQGLPWLVVALLLLIGGWYASQRLIETAPAGQPGIETFREWLWGTRSLDLAAQVGIIFVGALGIAALLPHGDEGPDGDDPLIVPRPPPACELPDDARLRKDARLRGDAP